MNKQTNLLIEWEGELSEDEIRAISTSLQSGVEGSTEIQTERGLSGLELVVCTIGISMATRVGEKIVDAVWSAIKAVSSSSPANNQKTLTLRAQWNNCEVKIQLPLDQQDQVREQLEALGKLVSAHK